MIGARAKQFTETAPGGFIAGLALQPHNPDLSRSVAALAWGDASSKSNGIRRNKGHRFRSSEDRKRSLRFQEPVHSRFHRLREICGVVGKWVAIHGQPGRLYGTRRHA